MGQAVQDVVGRGEIGGNDDATLYDEDVTVAVAARAVLAWQGLRARTAAVRRREARLETIEEDLHARFRRLRGQAQDLNAAAERALWSLPRSSHGSSRSTTKDR